MFCPKMFGSAGGNLAFIEFRIVKGNAEGTQFAFGRSRRQRDKGSRIYSTAQEDPHRYVTYQVPLD